MLPLDQRKLFYDAIVKQIKQYASIMWTSCSENIRKVFRLQKHAARVILSADTKENSIQLFKQLGRVPFYGEAKINKSILVYKRISGDCSSCMNLILIRNADVNERNKIWNKIPSEIRNKQNLMCFQKSMLEHFANSYKNLNYFVM